jgi:hypothetical protein
MPALRRDELRLRGARRRGAANEAAQAAEARDVNIRREYQQSEGLT